MREHADYLIVGGGVAGGHAAFEIRKHDKAGTILVVSDDNEFPYDRPPLSKEYLAGKMRRRELFFRADSYYARNRVKVLRGSRARAVDVSSRRVTLEDGSELSYGCLLLATGGRVRRLNLPGADLNGVYYLRTLRDCDNIRSTAHGSRKAVIIGGGFIGCELAATLTSRGLKVTLIELTPKLLSAAIDSETSSWVQEYHSKKGVRVLTSTSATALVGADGKANGVQLKDGEVISSDFVAVGVGIIPNTELAEAGGLRVDRGVVVNEHMRTSADGVYAAGDVARFYSPIFKRHLRVEHVDVAQKQGAVAGANMARRRMVFDELPYFFSNQFDLEINALGDLSQRTAVVRRGALNARTGFIQFYLNGQVLDGVLAVNADWRDIERAKSFVLSRTKFDDPSLLSNESKALSSFARGSRKVSRPAGELSSHKPVMAGK